MPSSLLRRIKMVEIQCTQDYVNNQVYEAGKRIAEELSKHRNTKVSVYFGDVFAGLCDGDACTRSVVCIRELKGMKKRFFGFSEKPILETIIMLKESGYCNFEINITDKINDKEIAIIDKEMAVFKEKVVGQKCILVKNPNFDYIHHYSKKESSY